MATNFRISNVAAKAMADALDDEVNVGGAVASIRILSGAQPADPDTVEAGTLLAELLMSATAFGAATDAAPGGLITAAAISDDSNADNTGTAGYFRVRNDNSGAPDDVCDGEVGAGGADLNMNTVEITSGSTVSITAMTVTMPES